jgi:hypothetical protein
LGSRPSVPWALSLPKSSKWPSSLQSSLEPPVSKPFNKVFKSSSFLGLRSRGPSVPRAFNLQGSPQQGSSNLRVFGFFKNQSSSLVNSPSGSGPPIGGPPVRGLSTPTSVFQSGLLHSKSFDFEYLLNASESSVFVFTLKTFQ